MVVSMQVFILPWPSVGCSNPASCAAGRAVLDVIENENLIENAADVGTYAKKRLKKLAKKSTTS